MGQRQNPERVYQELNLALSALLPDARRAVASRADGATLISDASQALKAARGLFEGVSTRLILEATLDHLSPAEREALEQGATPDPFSVVARGTSETLLSRLVHRDSSLGPGLRAIDAFAEARGFDYVLLSEFGPTLPGVAVLSAEVDEDVLSPVTVTVEPASAHQEAPVPLSHH